MKLFDMDSPLRRLYQSLLSFLASPCFSGFFLHAEQWTHMLLPEKVKLAGFSGSVTLFPFSALAGAMTETLYA
jgi:hypothetical protein